MSTKAENREIVLHQFTKDIANHEIKIIRDNGVDRQIRFKKPGTSSYWFDLITWHGRLCIDGDMGTWVFCRIEDMFEFFRTDRDINPQYWGEKLLCGKTEYRENSEGVFREALESASEDFRSTLSKRDQAKFKEEIEEMIAGVDSQEYMARAVDFEFVSSSGKQFTFDDFWEHDIRDYTYGYLWCCNAILWGIRQYDAAKENGKGAASV